MAVESQAISLESTHREALQRLLHALVNQQAARVLVPPQSGGEGYWFGGGNITRTSDGRLWIVGRYRNAGDSRTGVAAGARGLELALFVSEDGGNHYEKFHAWSKPDLTYDDREVVSIEGSHLHVLSGGAVELYVSTEKAEPYPAEVSAYQKPGTGVWSIDVLRARDVKELFAAKVEPVIPPGADPEYLHVKDPVVFTQDGDTLLLFAGHPFTWSSMTTGYARRRAGAGGFEVEEWDFVRRGAAWDVAGARITESLIVPRLGVFADFPETAVYFYDGLECYRKHEENPHAVQRPRGYSCEELGGAFAGAVDQFPQMQRLSRIQPLFVSPHGTGCSRYVSTVVTVEGIHVTWQRSEEDRSQPLVGHFLSMTDVENLLR